MQALQSEAGEINIISPKATSTAFYKTMTSNELVDTMKDELLRRNYIQDDETTLQVIDNNGKESKYKKYMWLYRSGQLKDPIILYDYQKAMSSSCPKRIFK